MNGVRHLSKTAASTFGACKRRYWWSEVQRIRPRVDAPALWLGKVVHACLQAAYGEGDWDADAVVARWLGERIEELGKVRLEQSEYERSVEEAHQLAQLGAGLMRRYHARWREEDAQRWEVLAVEERFRERLPVPCKACAGSGLVGGWLRGDPLAEAREYAGRCPECDGSGFVRASAYWDWVGVWDRVCRDRNTGAIYVFETKTTSEKHPEHLMTTYQLDAQPRSYLWAARKRWGSDVKGIVYDVIRKKVPEEPKTTQCKSCKGTGERKDGACEKCRGTGVGGVSRAALDSTTVAYYLAVIDRYPHIDRASYGEVLDRVRASERTLLWRMEQYVSELEINEWLADAYDVARDVMACGTSNRWARNLGACDAPGRSCPYRQLCIEDDPTARLNYERLERRRDDGAEDPAGQ